MAKSNYYIGPMGNLYHSSGVPLLKYGQEHNADTRTRSEERTRGQEKPVPVLHLRPGHKGKGKEQEAQMIQKEEVRDDPSDVPDQISETPTNETGDHTAAARRLRFPDGPWIRHSDEIDEDSRIDTEGMRDDITIQEGRERHKKHLDKFLKAAKTARRKEPPEILCIMTAAPTVDMSAVEGDDDELLDLRLDRWFVNSHLYLEPGAAMPPSVRDSYHHDWAWNARGVYYRYFYSPEWVTGDHSLWIPTFNEVDWDDRTEEMRRIRARTFLKHALRNEGWNRSEYAWEADAWTDVFGQMKNDPAIAA